MVPWEYLGFQQAKGKRIISYRPQRPLVRTGFIALSKKRPNTTGLLPTLLSHETAWNFTFRIPLLCNVIWRVILWNNYTVSGICSGTSIFDPVP